MPKCCKCNKTFASKKDLTLVRSDDGKWEVLCNKCIDIRNKTKQEIPDPIEDNELDTEVETSPHTSHSAETIQQPAVEDPATAAFDKIQDTLRNLIMEKKEETQSHKRQHDRKDTDMTVTFYIHRDNTPYTGRVKDISQGGLRFHTSTPLEEDNILELEVGTGSGDEVKTLIRSTAQVRRVKEVSTDRYEIGVRFVKKIMADGKNRRQYKRHNVDMAAYYTRKGSKITNKGIVRDISQGGCRLVVDEKMQAGEQFPVVLRGDHPTLAKSDIVALAEIVRIKQLRRGEWDIGCKYVKMHIRKRHA